MKTAADLFALLDQLSISHITYEHEPLFTVEQQSAARERIPGCHTKNLFLKDKKGALFLLVAEAHATIPLKHLHGPLGASSRFSFGSPDLLRAVWGVEPGSVTPFGAINDGEKRVTVVLDEAMMRHETLGYHPLVNTMTTTIGRDDLIRFLVHTGHPPRIMPVSEPTPDTPSALQSVPL